MLTIPVYSSFFRIPGYFLFPSTTTKNVQCTLKLCRPASEKPASQCRLHLWSLDAVYTTVLWRTELGFPRPFRFVRKILSPDVALAVGLGSSPCKLLAGE